MSGSPAVRALNIPRGTCIVTAEVGYKKVKLDQFSVLRLGCSEQSSDSLNI